ncbi:MAG TPA: hypothetical protein PLY77_12230, partial [Plasticicumulans sp.]|nr:hypothetical protein [Plasticicumulans sp.]
QAAAAATGEEQVIAASLDKAQTAVARSAEELEAANTRLRQVFARLADHAGPAPAAARGR